MSVLRVGREHPSEGSRRGVALVRGAEISEDGAQKQRGVARRQARRSRMAMRVVMNAQINIPMCASLTARALPVSSELLRGERKTHLEDRAARPAFDGDRSVVRRDDRLHDGQPEPRAAGLACAGTIGTCKPLEEGLRDAFLDAGSVVADAYDGVAVFAGDAQPDVRSGRGVDARVGQQVREYLMHPRAIADDHDGFVGNVQRPFVIATGHLCVGERLDREAGEVDPAHHEFLTLVESGQEQQVFDEARHPQRLRLNPLQRGRRAFCGRRRILRRQRAQRELRVPADRRQECATRGSRPRRTSASSPRCVDAP